MKKQEMREAVLEFMRKDGYVPMSAEDLLYALSKVGDGTKLWQEILALEEEGEIFQNKRHQYGVPEKMGLVLGRFQQKDKGFGFVLPDKKEITQDIFIGPRDVNGAMNGDKVLARVTKQAADRRAEGEIFRIISRANNKVVGIFHDNREFAFVEPDDKKLGQDVYVLRSNFNGARDGQKVVAEITEWPSEHRKAEGKIVEVLGNIGDVGLEILSIIKQNDLPLTFPDEVIAASKKIPKSIKASELKGRRDLRERLIVTVDGEDAKDLDDAVYVERLENGEYFLGVYIADVSYYVTEDSILDREAYSRGTSVYLVDRVLPMLPERLSNGICSLNAGEDRLSFACEMRMNSEGEVLAYDIFPAVINVRHRLSYNMVRRMLAGEEEICCEYADILPMIKDMDALRLILNNKRERRGAINFDLPEQKVILDEKLHPVEIVQRVQGNAENLIEEFMLAANETVAQHMFKKKWPFIYRVHDIPAEDRMKELGRLLASFNVPFVAGEDVQPKEIQKAIEAMVGRPEERLVMTVALRSMRQAVYQTDNVGHFGLAAEYYTHFTSPIRRYPDLIVHRMLRKTLHTSKLTVDEATYLEERLDDIASHSSMRERAAADAERATVELKKCEYMADHIGEEFEGTISGVTNFGMFVELANGVEGLVHISSLVDDYYDYDEEHYCLVGKHTKHAYRLGDKVRIEVLQVNISLVAIDFIMAGEDASTREYLRQQLLKKQGTKGGASRAPARTKSSVKASSKSSSKKESKHEGRRGAKHKATGNKASIKEKYKNKAKGKVKTKSKKSKRK